MTSNKVTVSQVSDVTTVKVTTAGPQGPAFADGDIGDIVISGGGAVATIDNGAVNNAKIASDAAIALSKLATGALPTGITVASANIPDLTIVNSDISASAAIAGTKISPDFGSQNIVTTGNITVTGTVDGRDVATDGTKLDGIEAAATADQTAAEILTAIKTVDGSESGLDADLLDGRETSSSGAANTIALRDASGDLFATNFSGSGASLTALNADNISSGTLARDRIENSAINADKLATSAVTFAKMQDVTQHVLLGRTSSGDGPIQTLTAIPDGITGTTQSASDNSTKIATTAYTDTAIANLVDSSPGTLNTLNELAAALGDDANFSTTVTNSIATKLPLAGGTLTGSLTGTSATFSGAITVNGEINGQRLTLSDDGASSPTFMLKTDDNSPWGFVIKNDTYSTSAAVGLKAYQNNDGNFHLRLQGDSAYNSFNLTQHDGTTDRSLVSFDTSGDATFAGNVNLPDDKKLQFGAPDLTIYHNGTTHDTYIDDQGAGQLRLCGSEVAGLNAAHDGYTFRAFDGGAVKLFFDGGDPKFETTSDGARIAGSLEVRAADGADSILDLNADNASNPNDKWRIISYTNNNFGINRAVSTEVLGFAHTTGNATFAGSVTVGGTNLNLNSAYIDFSGSLESVPTTAAAIYRPADNTLAISTANNLALTVDSGQHVTLEEHLYVKGGGTANKFETTASGVAVTGKFGINVSSPNENVQIHEAAATKSQLQFTNTDTGSGSNDGFVIGITGTEDAIIWQQETDKGLTLASGGLAALTLDSSQNATFAGNVSISNTSPSIALVDTNNNSDYQIKNVDGALAIQDTSNSNANRLIVQADGSININGDTTFAGDVNLPDGKMLIIGDNTDIELYHSGAWNYLRNGSGDNFVIQVKDTEGNYDNAFVASPEGATQLYWNGTKKIETKSNGCEVTGRLGVGIAPLRQFHIHEPSAATCGLMLTNTGTGSSNDSQGFQFKVASDGTANIDQREEQPLDIIMNGNTALGFDTSRNATFSGNVALNGATTGVPLHVYGSSDTAPIIAFTRNTTHGDWQGAGLGMVDEGGSYKGALTFYTHDSNGTKNASVTEKLRIASNGDATFTDHINVKGGGTANKFETTSDGAKVTGSALIEQSGTTAGGNYNLALRNTHAGNDYSLIYFQSTDSGSTTSTSASIRSKFVGTGSTNGKFEIQTRNAGTLTTALTLDETQNATFAGNVFVTAAGANRLSMSHSSGGNFVIKNPTAATLSFGTDDNDDELIIANGGNTTIKEHLYVKGGGTANKFETTANGTKTNGSHQIQQAGAASLQIGSTDASGATVYLDGDSDGNWSGGDYAYIQHTTGGDLLLVANNPASDAAFQVYVAEGNTHALTISDTATASFSGNVNASKSSEETDWATKSLPSGDSGLYVQNPSTTNGTYSSIGIISKNSSSTDQSFSIVAESLAGGHRPNVYLSQRSGANAQTSAITIDSAGSVYLNHDGTSKVTTKAHGAVIEGTGTAVSATLKVNTTSSGNFQHSQENFVSTLGQNETNVVAIGRAGSAKNSGIIGYKYSGTAGSDSNKLTFGHWAANDLLTIDGAGKAIFAGQVQFGGDVNPSAVFDRGSANSTNVNFKYNGTLTGQVSAADTDFQLSAVGASTPMSFYLNGEERVKITADGNLGVGNDSPYSNASFNSLTIGKTKKGLIELKDENDVAKAHLYETDGDFNVSTVGGAGNIKFVTGGTLVTALTIDQNQAATFAGSVTASDIKGSSTNTIYYGNIANGNVGIYTNGEGNSIILQRNTGAKIFEAVTGTSGGCKLYYGEATDPKLQTTSDGAEISNAADSKVDLKFHYSNNSGYSLVQMDNANNLILDCDPTGAGSNSFIQLKVDGSEVLKLDSKATFAGSLEVKGHGDITAGSHNYAYGRGNSPAGISIYGEEAAFELVASDASNHAGSFLFRHHNNKGFGFVHNGTSEELELKAFTSSADNFTIHSTGAQVSSLVTALTVDSNGHIDILRGLYCKGRDGVGAMTIDPYELDTNEDAQPVSLVIKSQKNTCLDLNRFYSHGEILQFRVNNDAVGYFSVNGTTSTHTSTGSDQRLKKDIEDWDEEVLPYFKALKPQKFRFNKEDDTAEKTKGYMAQDNLDKFPEAYPLNPTDDRYWFAPQHMIPYLMKALKEASTKIEVLETEVAALKAGS